MNSHLFAELVVPFIEIGTYAIIARVSKGCRAKLIKLRRPKMTLYSKASLSCSTIDFYFEEIKLTVGRFIAVRGDLDLLIWSADIGCRLDHKTCASAALGGI